MTDVAARITAEVADRYRIDREFGAGGMLIVVTNWFAEPQAKVGRE